ncbi:uncharacterized protein LOC115699980 [Cannabis sativa]|uniref:uncharacterized protein LOC115699980 n=1 Tax=Cannabis sativa TaxID=3483 RepID=UPI0029CA0DDA|nr:uncharacterized protein LOC115699980 [Cannabis sativa]
MFNKCPLIFQRLKRGEDPKKVPLYTLDMWVQIHDLKTGYMLDRVVRSAGAYVGKFIKADLKNFNGLWRDYLRVRASINIEKPLKRHMKLCKEDGDWIWANFKYEHVPTFCFVCGIIGHSERFCLKTFDQPLDQIVKSYGNGMRAQTRKKNYLIGAQWLCSGMETKEMVGGGGVARRSEAEDGAIMQPKIMEIDSVDVREDRESMIVGKNKSVLMGKDGTNNEYSGDSSNGGNLTKAVLNEEDLLLIMENKCRRTEMEKAYAESEVPGVNMGQLNENLDGSKNVLKRFEEKVRVLEYGRDYIDVIITDGVYGHWRLTGLYGEPKRHLRRKTWELLTVLKNKQSLPWCIIGDLNNITSSEDKRGNNPYPDWLIEGFNDVLIECGLHDLELFGHPYTWERLSWHYGLGGVVVARNQNFRFENSWLKEPICLKIIADSWSLYHSEGVLQKLKACGETLKIWGKDYSGDFSRRIKECKKEICQWKKGCDVGSVGKYQQAVNKLNNILLQKEVFWKQRSKQLWLREGDNNSKYFHATATARRRRNAIQRLRIATGEWVDWQGGLSQVVVDYFTDLFTPSAVNFAEVVDCVPSTVTVDQNSKLLEPVLDEEIKRALFHMHPDKSPSHRWHDSGILPEMLEYGEP